jgi:hypothetical protein
VYWCPEKIGKEGAEQDYSEKVLPLIEVSTLPRITPYLSGLIGIV